MSVYVGLIESLTPTRVNINGKLYELPNTNLNVGDTVSVIIGFNNSIQFLEKITSSMVDEVALRRELEPTFIIPVSGIISSIFGPRRNPSGYGNEFHDGIDISADENDPIYAIESGNVCELGQDLIYGNFIKIVHADEIISIYGHLNEFTCALNDKISQGQQIGTIGNTGKSSGPHLHLGLEYKGKALNPRVFFDTRMLLGTPVVAKEF